jgi:acyl-CoA synthetase (AMP-forming)/AMP-acid ligase II
MSMDYCSFLIHENNASADDTAVAFDESSRGRVTYGELRLLVNTTAATLDSGSRGLVLLALGNDLDGLTAYLASLAAGHAVAVIDPESPTAAMVHLLERFAPDWCMLPPRLAPPMAALDYVQAATPHVGEGFWRRRGESRLSALHPELCLLLPTSGSTGNPKLVRLSARNVMSNTDDIVQSLCIQRADRAITSVPMHYSYGLSVIHSHLRAGASLVLTRRSLTDREFWNLVCQQKCTSFAGVPFSYRTLRRLDLDRLDKLSIVKMTQAGGKLAAEEVRYFHELMERRRGKFYVMYGQTEASPRMTVLPHRDIPGRWASVGRPLASGSVRIQAIEHAESDAGASEQEGEIVYSGPNVMLGYADTRADLASGDLMNGVLHTGDVGHLDSDGFLFITGRARRIAKVLGRRVNLEDVESAARSWGDCAAVEHDERVYVFAASAAPAERVKDGVLQSISIQPDCLRIIQVPELPLRNNGKVDYRRLLKQAKEGSH